MSLEKMSKEECSPPNLHQPEHHNNIQIKERAVNKILLNILSRKPSFL